MRLSAAPYSVSGPASRGRAGAASHSEKTTPGTKTRCPNRAEGAGAQGGAGTGLPCAPDTEALTCSGIFVQGGVFCGARPGERGHPGRNPRGGGADCCIAAARTAAGAGGRKLPNPSEAAGAHSQERQGAGGAAPKGRTRPVEYHGHSQRIFHRPQAERIANPAGARPCRSLAEAGERPGKN